VYQTWVNFRCKIPSKVGQFSMQIYTLGAKNSENVVFIYQQIRAFRTSFTGIMKYHRDMSIPELTLWLEGAIATIDRSHLPGTQLVDTLRIYAERSYIKVRGKELLTTLRG